MQGETLRVAGWVAMSMVRECDDQKLHLEQGKVMLEERDDVQVFRRLIRPMTERHHRLGGVAKRCARQGKAQEAGMSTVMPQRGQKEA